MIIIMIMKYVICNNINDNIILMIIIMCVLMCNVW